MRRFVDVVGTGIKPVVENVTLIQQKALMLALFCLVVISASAWIINQFPELTLKSDFFVRWYAIDRLYHEGRNLYDEQNGNDVDEMVHGPGAVDTGMDFYYPAHILLFIGPLGLLSYKTANLIWLICIQLLFIAGLAIMMRVRKWPSTMNQATVFLLAAIFAVPTYQHLIYGQFNTIGILSLSLVYLALDRERYGLAGIFSIGLTLKPQAHILTLVLLFLWIITNRKRWRFLFSFATVMFVAWLLTELFQSGWVSDFIQSARRYSDLPSVADIIWNPNQALTAILILVSIFIFWRNRDTKVQSSAFCGTLALSLAVWSIVYPFAFTFHTLILILAIILVASNYRSYFPNLYRPLMIILAVLYFVGWIGVVLASPNLFGLIAYVTVLPIVIIITALPLCLQIHIHENATEYA